MSLKSTKAGEYYRSFVNKASGVMTHEINRIFAVPRVVYERVQTQTNNGYKLCIINKSTWFLRFISINQLMQPLMVFLENCNCLLSCNSQFHWQCCRIVRPYIDFLFFAFIKKKLNDVEISLRHRLSWSVIIKLSFYFLLT